MKIKLRQIALNPEAAFYRNIVIKLAYVLDKNHPTLKIFENSEIAKKREWSTYGVEPLDEYEGLEHSLHFRRVGDKERVNIAGLELEITYLTTGEEEYDYPRTGKEKIPYYEFLIEQVKQKQPR